MMGLKKSALFLPVKQYPDVVFFAVGVSDLDQGRRVTPTFLCKCFSRGACQSKFVIDFQ